MLTIYIGFILSSFFLTFILSIPFIQFLYKFNIRRISKQDLVSVLPGRAVKLGTPIMGGAVIIISVVTLLLLSSPFWELTPIVVALLVLGGIVGGIDEYSNTLGRTFKAIRIMKSGQGSLFPVQGILLRIKRIALMPWSYFEEVFRMMGSEQRGLKSHYKILMHLGLALITILYLIYIGYPTYLNLGFGYAIDSGVIFYLLLGICMIFFATAFGITDGMDGLSAGTHSVTFTILGIFFVAMQNYQLALVSFIIVGAELAFLYFNIFPARMEMSDVGTVPLGMIFVLLSFVGGFGMPLFVLGGLYVIEILSSVIQVWSVKLRKKKVFLVAPIHHHFEKLGWPETKVTMRFWLVNAILGLVSVMIAIG